MPTPTVAPSGASRIAFDLTARTARQANARSASVASSAGVARGERPGRRVVARRVDGVGGLQQHAARHRTALDAGLGGPRLGDEQPQVLLAAERLERVRLERGRDDHLGEDVGELRGHLAA